jgi:hypothetical protein
MKNTVVLLFYILFSLTTLTLSAQSTITEVVSEKSQGVSNKLGVSKKSGDSTCISVSQNSDSLQQGQEVVITVKGCQNLEMLKVLVSGITAEINDKGVAKMSRTSGMIGTHNIPVSIVYRDKDGNLKTESYTVTYKVRKALSQ